LPPEKETEQQPAGRWTDQEQRLFEEAYQMYGKDWKKIKKHVGTIVSVSGYHMDYEGTSITMVVNVDGNNKHINLHMENTMELFTDNK
jgi:hypothetical protein